MFIYKDSDGIWWTLNGKCYYTGEHAEILDLLFGGD